ncbi:MAG: CpaF family protein [Actinobacteria bacterium]|nr:CpaF family protein [Actinomycetota bacterium]
MKLSDRLSHSSPPGGGAATTTSPPPKTPARVAATTTAKPATTAKRKIAKASSVADVRRRVHQLVLADVAPQLSARDELDDAELERQVRAAVDRVVEREDVEIPPLERRRFVESLLSDILGYGPLDALLADPDVTEIMCNAHDTVFVERRGKLERADVRFADEDAYRRVIERIVSQVGRRVDESSPMVDARLPDGSRVNAIVPPLALRGPALTIRKFPDDPLGVSDLITFGTVSSDLAVFLEACVRGKCNVLVSGGTSTGKTTLLNVLSSFIPAGERIITIEDAAELRLQQPHVVTTEARPANAEGAGLVSIRDLVRNALRMRPDRIVVGEVRGAEALDMLQAMNTGHEGSLTTVHANSCRDALSRLETLVLMAGFDLPVRAIREQIVAAVDVIVQLDRTAGGSRAVVSVQEVQGLEDTTIILQELFRFEHEVASDGRDVGRVQPTGLRPKLLDKLQDRGVDVPAAVLRPEASRARAGAGARTTTTRGRKAGR